MDSDYDYSDSDNSDSDVEDQCSGFELCRRGSGSCGRLSTSLPFDPTSIESVILKLSDRFDFRVIMQDGRMKTALVVASGLTLAGSLIGKYYGGRVGAVVGGAVGGACGIGVVAVSMRDIWPQIKGKLAEVYDIVYDYLAGLGIDDYMLAAKFLMAHSADSTQLALVVIQITSDILGKKILSSLTDKLV